MKIKYGIGGKKMTETREEKIFRKELERQWKADFSVPEGQMKVIMRFGAFNRAVMSSIDQKFDEKTWDIIPASGGLGHGQGQGAFGGLHPKWLGSEKVYTHRKRWQTFRLDKEKNEIIPVSHDEILDFIPLQPTTYLLILKNVETAPPEKWRVTVFLLITYKVINIYKPLYKAPLNWHEKVMELISTASVSWLGKQQVDGILKARDDPLLARTEIGKDPVIQDVLPKDWGIEVLEKMGIRIFDFKAPSELTALIEKKQKEKVDAEALRERTKVEVRTQAFQAKIRARQTIGTVIEMLAVARHKKPTDIQKEIDGDPQLKKEFLAMAQDLVMRKLGIEGAAYLDIRTQGGSTTGGGAQEQGFISGLIEKFAEGLIKLEAVKQRMPQGREEKSSDEQKESKERTKKAEKEKSEITKEDLERVEMKYY